MLTHKEMTAHIRKRVKAEGIRARVRLSNSCGIRSIQIIVPSYDARFTPAEIKTLSHIADCNHLTGSRGRKIDPSHESILTGKQQWDFEYHG